MLEATMQELQGLLADPANPAESLGQLAHQIGSSYRTLTRLCRDELGMTFRPWRTQLRLHRALVLLAEGYSVTAVAHTCGWSSPSAFIDVFRNNLGYTPGRREPSSTAFRR